MSPIKDFNVIYTATNDDDTVSPGDIIVGAVIFRLTKDVKVKSVSLKIKGDAFAQWSDGDTKYFAQRRYFKVKSYVVEKNPKGKWIKYFKLRVILKLNVSDGNFEALE